MAKRRDITETGETPQEKVWGDLPTDEKIETLRKIISEMFLRMGESDLLDRVTKGDQSFKVKKGGD
jgi:hypothetical protein